MSEPTATAPPYLEDYADLYAANPRGAAIKWFREARYGMFIHYGLYSLLGRHEWVQYREKIPVADYEKLAEKFTADRFDADAIAEFAVDAGMKYVNITTRHHDSFCLFDTKGTGFKSTNSPCGRDLVGELATACAGRELGLFLYYSHGRDWRHPHAPNNDAYGGSARPEYDPPEPSYRYGDEHDLSIYVEFMRRRITELLTNYGPIAGIWLDGIMTPLTPKNAKGEVIEGYNPPRDGDPFGCQELYDCIHAMQPQALVSYKQGYLGTEDFFAPEHEAYVEAGGKPQEVCTTMAPGSWGYKADMKGKHKKVEDVWGELRHANRDGYLLLLNTGPLPEGSLDPEDTEVLRAVGKRIREEGMPK